MIKDKDEGKLALAIFCVILELHHLDIRVQIEGHLCVGTVINVELCRISVQPQLSVFHKKILWNLRNAQGICSVVHAHFIAS